MEEIASADNKAQVNTTNLSDGKYEVVVEGLSIDGKILLSSKPQYFYIVNKTPELKISFDGYQVDLNKEIKGRIEFVVKTQSSSVPMSRLEFHFKDPSGKIETRSTDYVIEEMRLGWRTGQLPNGSYEIWMVGKVNSKGISSQVETAHKIVNLKN